MFFRLKNTVKLPKKRFLANFRFISSLNLFEEELNSEIKHKIESHWKDKIDLKPQDNKGSNGDKYYVLSMFPYPSGALHMGHVRVYAISDAIARFQRMNGKNVIHPIGWDAFGLPAENAAIQHKIAPQTWTKNNISHMKSQLKRLGCSFDWDRELSTCDPEYYKFTQELFLKLYDSGLVYQKEAIVNWDPIDKTVLADEQVDENGVSWRSGAKVERKPLRQWFVKTTRFARELLEGLNDPALEDWRDVIKLQKHWIGDCDGVNFDFEIQGHADFITLWTPHPEFIKDVKFVALTTSNILARTKGAQIDDSTRRLDLQLTNPFTNDQIPVFVTDTLALPDQCDAFLGIPSICQQATLFAQTYNISFKNLVEYNEEERQLAREKICLEAQRLGIGGHWSSAKLRDWLISRQRFWGTPIPIIHCSSCGAQPVRNLPVTLPEPGHLNQKLGEIQEWIDCTCPKCHKGAKRETDTMDTFVDSSWYYLRYLDPKNTEIFSKECTKNMPVDLYIGGKEHAVLHLYYARFMAYFLNSLGLLPEKEPFKRLLVQGMVMGQTFRIKGTGEYVQSDQVEILDAKKNKGVLKSTGQPVVVNWEKMSKSKHNGVDPSEMFNQYGTDTTRLLILADVAPISHRNWNANTFPGVLGWQKRLWLTVRDFIRHRNNPPPLIKADEFKAQDDYMFDSRNYYVKGATFNYCGSQQHSVAISKQQGLTNSIRRAPPAVFARSLQFERALAAQIILLAPMAPHFASELWAGFLSAPGRLNASNEIDWSKSVLEQKWPVVDPDYNIDLDCHINNIERCVVKIPKQEFDAMSDELLISLAGQQKEIVGELAGKVLLGSSYLRKGDDGVVNFRTKFVRSDKKAQVV